MMDPTNGDYELIAALSLDDLRAHEAKAADDGKVLVCGTEPQLAAMSRRIRLGERELEQRKARRAQQRASRRRNR